MFRTLKVVTALKQINEKCLTWFPLPSLNSNFVPVNLTSRNYRVRSEIVKKPVEFCQLGDIEKLKNLEKELSTKSSQEKICKIILKQDIRVPNLFDFSKITQSQSFSSSTKNYRTNNAIPEDVSLGRFNAEEDNANMKNVEKLSKLTKEKSYSEISCEQRR